MAVISRSGKKLPVFRYQIRQIAERIAAPAFRTCPPGSFSALELTLPASLPIGDDRTGEGHRADEDAEEELDPQDVDLDLGLLAR